MPWNRGFSISIPRQQRVRTEFELLKRPRSQGDMPETWPGRQDGGEGGAKDDGRVSILSVLP